MKVLLTGGAGYIGSHTAVELLRAGHDVVIIDNLSNANESVIENIQKIVQRPVNFYHGDLLNPADLDRVFADHKIDAVVHFAGYKAVGESVAKPLMYYQNNLVSTLNLLETMTRYGVKNLIFSSSATVYGIPEKLPVVEESPLSTLSPYGYTKLAIEHILTDVAAADPSWNITMLRYFNPVGADASGLIGESPRGIPNNLFPFIMRVATGELPELGIFGNDYDTPDGTCVRDYIHVTDLAIGHICALEHLGGLRIYNLGTGRGYSVMECVQEFSRACGFGIPYVIKPRRAGDAPAIYADPTRAANELNWHAQRDLADMCRDCWKYQKNKQ
ncbi:MAG: UDP-glucose 4-epimerase GalE [Alphaproteobacteria bacterium]|nr:UDP-glucose 4-epimerase GalE [Alphaproteobacteria bacterium]